MSVKISENLLILLTYNYFIERSVLILNHFAIIPTKSVLLFPDSLFVPSSCLADSPNVPDAQKTSGDELTTTPRLSVFRVIQKPSEMCPKPLKNCFTAVLELLSAPKEYERGHRTQWRKLHQETFTVLLRTSAQP